MTTVPRSSGTMFIFCHSVSTGLLSLPFLISRSDVLIEFVSLFRNIVMRELAPQFQIPWSIPTEAEDIPIVPTTSGTM